MIGFASSARDSVFRRSGGPLLIGDAGPPTEELELDDLVGAPPASGRGWPLSLAMSNREVIGLFEARPAGAMTESHPLPRGLEFRRHSASQGRWNIRR